MSDYHQCHFCGEFVSDGYALKADGTRYRHWLSDCRPDLVEHEIGDTCTWAYRRKLPETLTEERFNCYAYQAEYNGPFTDSHSHFMTDGPM